MSDPQSPDDRTVRIAPAAAGALPGASGGDPLPLGTRLAEFEITGFVGEGGFSIVYLAWDHSLERRVALKEYMPSSLAARHSKTHTVAARSERHRETFEAGLKSFINEGKLLAQFDHPALVKVYRFWEQHGTAYMVMPFYEGLTLKQHVRALATPPDEAALRQLLNALTAALLVLHRAQCFHRDIAPDNILLLADSGKPLLLDFGAARRVIGDKTQALTVILKPGYAPVEQYAEDPGMRQGPWTDVYALAAVVHWAITGKTPPPSVSRVLNDAYLPLVQSAAGRYSEGFLAAIDRALRVLPDQRTPSIERLRDELGLDLDLRNVQAESEATVLRPPPPPPRQKQHPLQPPRPRDNPTPPSTRGLRWAIAGGATLVAAASAAWWMQRALPPPALTLHVPQAPTPAPSPLPAPTAAAPAAATAAQALAQLMAARNAAIDVKATQAEGRSNTPLRVTYQAAEAGYAYVFGVAADAGELLLLHPAPGVAPAILPPSGQLEIAAAEATSVQQMHLLIAREPRDLAESAWVMRKQSWARRLDAGNNTAAWGPPRCAADALRCDAAFGMTEVIKVTNVISAPRMSAGAEKPPTTTADKPSPPARIEPTPPRRQSASSEGKLRPPPNAECVEALRRASLGDTSPQLIEKLKSVDCR